MVWGTLTPIFAAMANPVLSAGTNAQVNNDAVCLADDANVCVQPCSYTMHAVHAECLSATLVSTV